MCNLLVRKQARRNDVSAVAFPCEIEDENLPTAFATTTLNREQNSLALAAKIGYYLHATTAPGNLQFVQPTAVG
jgi:hypothetical protein